ncbi:MAG: dihydropteroate synthase [Burkholderiaceae bacterium]
MHWHTSRFQIDLSSPKVMGIVNITPDSFSDGGRWAGVGGALSHGERLLADGAHMLDLGAESTRPGAPPVPLDEELARLLPVLREAVKLGVPISVDTYKPAVMRAALDAGADIVNDIWALRQPATPDCPSALDVVAQHPSCGVCVMHMHRDPQTMQVLPMQGDVVPQVVQFLKQTSEQLEALGVKKDRILIDPGIGFGKTPAQNLALLARQQALAPLGLGVLAGWSRKSTLGHVVGDGGAAAPQHTLATHRLVPSVVAALLAVQHGAHVVRVHDVRETCQALAVWHAVQSESGVQN